MDKNILQYEGSISTLIKLAVLTFAQVIAIIFQAVALARAITEMFLGAAVSAALPSLAIFFFAYVVRHLIQRLSERTADNFAEKSALSLQQQVVEKVFAIGPAAVGKHGSGRIITLLMEGTVQFKTYLQLYLPRFVSMVIVPAVLALYVLYMDRLSAIILIIVLPILIIFLILLGMTAQKQMDAQLGTYKLLASHFVDSLRGLVTLKYLGRSKTHEKAIASVSNKYRIATNRTLRVAFLSTFALDFFTSISIAIIAVELGLRLISGGIGLEVALAILIIAPEYFNPVRALGNDFHATMDGKDAGKEMQAILAEETIVDDAQITLPTWGEQSELQGINITQTPKNGDAIMRELQFTAKGFTKIGVVGMSGAGKSTFINLLAGFTAPTAGEFSLDGVKVPHLATASWQKQISYIPQHPTIFSGTVAANIRFYEKNATDQDVEKAAKQVGLHDLIDTFPNRYQERIGQGGRALSGGEEQRIALARVLLQNRPVVLLDEPTAHLDIETEHEIKQIMLPILEKKLVFFATHRLHWMKQMDEIYLIENGALIETGTYKELVSQNGAFQALIEAYWKERVG